MCSWGQIPPCGMWVKEFHATVGISPPPFHLLPFLLLERLAQLEEYESEGGSYTLNTEVLPTLDCDMRVKWISFFSVFVFWDNIDWKLLECFSRVWSHAMN
jgi:hypothetical protein